MSTEVRMAKPTDPPAAGAEAAALDTVLVAASDRPLRERIRATLVADGFDVLPGSGSAAELLARKFDKAPGTVVLAAKRPDPDSLAHLRQLHSALPKASVVLVSERVANGDVRKALDSGADGVLHADRIEECLTAAVRAVMTGQLVVPAESREQAQRAVLTNREKQILGLVVMGLTNNEIAAKLFLAESTVKSHLSSSFAKLGVSSRNEAVGYILDPVRGRALGILTIPSESVGISG